MDTEVDIDIDVDEIILQDSSSLIESICISTSIKEYEEMAIELGTNGVLFTKIQAIFWRLASNESHLFNTGLFTNQINRLYLAIWENYILSNSDRIFHIFH